MLWGVMSEFEINRHKAEPLSNNESSTFFLTKSGKSNFKKTGLAEGMKMYTNSHKVNCFFLESESKSFVLGYN